MVDNLNEAEVIDTKDDPIVLDVLDLEHYQDDARDRRPRARTYRYRVDKNVYSTSQSQMTGQAILASAGRPVDGTWLLNQYVKAVPTPVSLTDTVDFRTPGIERFKTLPRDQTDGTAVGNMNSRS